MRKTKQFHITRAGYFICVLVTLVYGCSGGPQYPGDQHFNDESEFQSDIQEDYDPRINDPCAQDAMYGVPSEYSSCSGESDGSVDEPLFDPIDPYANEAENSNSCPNGCEYHIPDCNIKGNISFETGEKIYHLPGQEFYNNTNIDPAIGERWFCTEAEAVSNGWRRSQK